MPSYSIGIPDDAWTGQADAYLQRIERIDDLIDQLADEVVLPILAEHYDASGLRVKSGRLKAAVSQRGAQGNVFQKTAMGFVVGVDYAVLPYARFVIEGTRPHDAVQLVGRAHHYVSHHGIAPHPIYFLTPGELEVVETALAAKLAKRD